MLIPGLRPKQNPHNIFHDSIMDTRRCRVLQADKCRTQDLSLQYKFSGHLKALTSYTQHPYWSHAILLTACYAVLPVLSSHVKRNVLLTLLLRYQSSKSSCIELCRTISPCKGIYPSLSSHLLCFNQIVLPAWEYRWPVSGLLLVIVVSSARCREQCYTVSNEQGSSFAGSRLTCKSCRTVWRRWCTAEGGTPSSSAACCSL